MLHLGHCSPSTVALLLKLVPVHQRFAAAYPKLPGDAIFYSALIAHGMSPRLSADEAAQLTAVSTELIQLAYGSTAVRVLTAGFIESPCRGRNQPWHFDYGGRTENLFVPLVPLTQRNGTEYVEWAEPDAGPAMLARHSERFRASDVEDLGAVPELGPHTVRRAEAQPFEVLRMPYYLLHRGVSNDEPQVRIMFFIATTLHPDYDLSEADKAPIVSWGD